MKAQGLDIVSGGTDTHLMLVDLRPKRLTGKVAEAALGRAHITCNKNGIPFDPEKPTVTSGIRLGTPAGTSRGFGIAEFRQVGELIAEVLDALSQKGAEEDAPVEAAVREKVKRLISRFPIYPGLTPEGERMRCPSCGQLDTQVKDSRPTEDSAAIRRRRVCLACNFRFTTFERVQLRELVVIKRNGRRVPFDRDKLMRSLQIALRKRPVEPERVEQMVSKIVRELESLGESEVSSETIGETVMEHLRELDDVAYVRFASVYRNFREAEGFRGGARRAVRRGRAASPPPRAKMSDAAPAHGRSALDQRFMQLALALGRRGLGSTWPNPAVGAVVVKDGVILGRGWTQPGGRPHAETEALKRAGKAARGATLYVTLEPCSHHGKTPPCADAIIRAGIARVVSALDDPNPEVAGQGHARCANAASRSRSGWAPTRRGAPTPATSGACARAGRRCCSSSRSRRRQGRRRRAQAGGDHRRGGAAARASDARADRRDPGRHRHGAVRRSGADLPAARHDGALAGAGRARRAAARAALDERRWRPRARLRPGCSPRRRLRHGGGDSARQGRRGVPRDGQGRPARSRARCLKTLAERGITRLMVEGGPTRRGLVRRADLVDEAALFRGAQARSAPTASTR